MSQKKDFVFSNQCEPHRGRTKEILKEFPEESRQWAVFRSRNWADKIKSWLETIGILAVEDNPKKIRSASR